MATTYALHQGTQPLLISLPHDGTELPAEIAARMTPAGLRLADTDWHVGRLYEFAAELGVSILRPRYSRYVVDLNRPIDGAALYPGQTETGICPLISFGNELLYRDGMTPDAAEVDARVSEYWRPYHAALSAELARLLAAHGRAVLWDAHSIRSEVPLFFEGRLPDLNIGTANGRSCAAELQQRLNATLSAQSRYSWVVNGRFKGGHITRHYGDPARGIDAVQLELAQINYMDEESFEYLPQLSAQLQPVIRSLLEAALRSLS